MILENVASRWHKSYFSLTTLDSVIYIAGGTYFYIGKLISWNLEKCRINGIKIHSVKENKP